jgi:hypothetical protein
MTKWLRDHGLALVTLAVFLGCWGCQVLAGHCQNNEERRQHGESSLSVPEYLRSGHFWESTGENWESAFLQAAAYVLLTVGLYQRGSAESKDPDKKEEVDRDPFAVRGKALEKAPWPVRRGGWILWLYQNSLSLAFVLLFIGALWMHAAGGASNYNSEQLNHRGETVSVFGYFLTSQFWFESLQNWQSEFMSLFAMVVLSVYLRQRGSPESKPVDAPNSHTGSG